MARRDLFGEHRHRFEFLGGRQDYHLGVLQISVRPHPAEYGFDTKGSWGSFIGRTFLSALFSGLGLGGLILVLTAGAEPLYREAYPEHLSISRMFTWHGIRTRSFFMGSLAGITLSFFFVAYVICFYLAANRLGAWAPAEVPYTDLLNTRVPWVLRRSV